MTLQAVEWDDKNTDTLKTMWARGASASVIAAQIPYCTRSAVLGKVSRLKLQPRRPDNARAATQGIERTTVSKGPPGPPRALGLRKERPSRIASSIFGSFTHAKPDPQPIPDTDPSDGKGITMIELTKSTCRWPKGSPGEPDFLFCGEAGANLEERRPYCPFHSRIAVDHAGTARSARRSRVSEEQPQQNF